MKVLPLLAAPLVAMALPAQCQQSMPPFAGTPMFFSLDGPTAPAGTALALFKCEGFTNVPPAPWTAAFAPDFNLDVVFRNLLTSTCSVGPTAALPDVDAVSIGLDWILSDHNGMVDVPLNRWGALTFTVSRDSLGRAGSPIRVEADKPEGPGTDVFSYVLPQSRLPGHLVGRTLRAQDGPEIGLAPARTTIDALDQFIPLYRSDAVIRGLLRPDPTLYFSVTNATLLRVPASWWAGTPPSGATILRTTWDVGRGKWGCVQPWRTYAAIAGINFGGLGLTQCEDIDGLALDIARSHILISTAVVTNGRCINRPIQILYRSLLTDGDPPPVPYLTQTGTEVATAAGLIGGDDVKAICSVDPIAPLRQTGGAPPNVIRLTTGTPSTVLTFPGIAHRLEGTTFLSCWPGAGPARVRSYGLGWPRGEAPGLIAAFLTVPGSGLAPTFLVGYARNPVSPFCGDPREWAFDVPAPLRMLVPALRFEVTWVGLDSATGTLAQAFPVGLDL